MKKILFLFIGIVLSINLFGTAQYPDKIIYNGKEYKLHTNPLETFFAKNPDLKPKTEVMSSALWRGYVATFEIRDNQLYVKDIEIQYFDKTDENNSTTKWKSVLKEVFPNQTDIKVDWISGLIILPEGELVEYVHMGYGSLYENYILLEMENGKLLKEKKLDYKEYEKYTERQYKEFKKTDEYKNIVKELKEGSKDMKMTEKEMDDFLKSYLTSYKTIILKD